MKILAFFKVKCSKSITNASWEKVIVFIIYENNYERCLFTVIPFADNNKKFNRTHWFITGNK